MNEQDSSYLNIISVCYIVLGCLMLPFSLLPLIHIFFGVAALFGATQEGSNSPAPAIIGLMFVFVGLLVMVGIIAIAICMIFTGVCIKRRTKYIFCMVISALACTFTPLGTILGIFSIILLGKPEVKAEFLEPACVPAEQ